MFISQHAEAKNIYERIALEAFVEINFAADCRDADTISVVRNTGNNAGEKAAVSYYRGASFQLAIFIGGQVTNLPHYRPEAQGVQTKLGPRAHRKNVANDSADAGGRALKRFDCAGVIVALDLKRDCPAIANIDDPGIFLAGFDKNVRAGRRQFLQLPPRVLVGAMLAPHHRENSEFGKIRFAAENFFNALEFLRRQSVLCHELGRDGWIENPEIIGAREIFRSRKCHRQGHVSESARALNRTKC